MGFDGNQWAIVALVFVLGWLIGLLSRSGGARWKRQAQAEEGARIAAEDRLAIAQARVVELERERPIAVGGSGVIGVAAAGRSDDLALVRGIGRERELRLNGEGIQSYQDLETLSDRDAARIEDRVGVAPGTIAKEQWREQAATLRADGIDAHRDRYL